MEGKLEICAGVDGREGGGVFTQDIMSVVCCFAAAASPIESVREPLCSEEPCLGYMLCYKSFLRPLTPFHVSYLHASVCDKGFVEYANALW